jgi:septum formation protein
MIILASGSPRRKMLLEWAEVDFVVKVSDSDEIVNPNLEPEQVAMDIAWTKNRAVQQMFDDRREDRIVISADTIVVLDGEIIGKPAHRDVAIEMLLKLSGKTHRVITGVCISQNNKTDQFHETTSVSFHELSPEQITHYVDVYKPFDKAGAYAIQEWIGVTGIHSIKGDFYNVMGLPVSRVLQRLKDNFNWKK